jgi:hypothetical protein
MFSFLIFFRPIYGRLHLTVCQADVFALLYAFAQLSLTERAYYFFLFPLFTFAVVVNHQMVFLIRFLRFAKSASLSLFLLLCFYFFCTYLFLFPISGPSCLPLSSWPCLSVFRHHVSVLIKAFADGDEEPMIHHLVHIFLNFLLL